VGFSVLLPESIQSDTLKHLNTLLRSSDFDEWLSHLADQKAKARILARLTSATFGNFGDCEPVGEGISEMRIRVGAGYRVYYTGT
jgi:putative addiction module killer protein